MSALGQKQTSDQRPSMSRFTPESGHWNLAVKCPLCAKSGHSALRQGTSLFDHLVGASEQCGRYVEAERLGSLEIDD